jgi:hypothetical protein
MSFKEAPDQSLIHVRYISGNLMLDFEVFARSKVSYLLLYI